MLHWAIQGVNYNGFFHFPSENSSTPHSNVTLGKITLANPQHISLQMRVKQGEPQPTGTAGKPVFIYRHLTHFISHLSMSALCPNLALCQHIISKRWSPLYKHKHTPPAFNHMVERQHENRGLSAARSMDGQILSTWKRQQLSIVKTHLIEWTSKWCWLKFSNMYQNGASFLI